METPQRNRQSRRRAAGGFTLVELMVVVLLISVLALLATPAMSVARDDRLAFDFARRTEQLIQRARARALGRGAAHLFVAAPSGTRGKFLLFEALDGTLPAAAGPNPVSTCKAVNEWADVLTFAPGAVSNNARVIDGFDLDTGGVNAVMDLRSAYTVDSVAATAVVMCVTPGGTTYVGQGSSIANAITDMQAQSTPFNTFMEIRFTRNRGGVPIGLQRSVLVAGSAAARIRSQ